MLKASEALNYEKALDYLESALANGYGNYYNTSKTASAGTRYTVNSVLKSGTQSMSINGSSAANATLSTTYNK